MKLFMVPVLVCLCASTCFAQAAAQPQAAAAKVSAGVPVPMMSMMSGKIKSVTVADPVKGTKSEIAVIDAEGQSCNFLVKATTTIYDPAFKAIVLTSLKTDANVKVKYVTTKEGVREAVSVSELN